MMIGKLRRYLVRLGQKCIISDGAHPSGLPLLAVENNDWYELSLDGEALKNIAKGLLSIMVENISLKFGSGKSSDTSSNSVRRLQDVRP